MGMGPFSSDSKTAKRDQTQSGPVTASQGTALAVQQGGRSRSVAQGAINLEDGANIGGVSLGNAKIGRGATLTITAPPSDNGLDQIAQSLEAAVKAQADNTAAALSSLGTIGPQPYADTGNPYNAFLAIGAAGVVAVGLIALAIVFRK